MLDDNIQKTYSLVIGQCTDLLQSKLKQQAQWAKISKDQDAIALIGLIKTITFKFEDQKSLPLALYLSKANLYNLRQSTTNNHDYLQRFQNLVDVATAYNGQLHDQAIVNIVTERLHPGSTYAALTAANQQAVQTASSKLYLAIMFIYQSSRRCYGKLGEELKNSFTKGNDDCPNKLISAYHLINEYKSWQPKSAIPESSGVAFAQKKGKDTEPKNKDDSWQKKATCHNCGKIGHIRPNCPSLKEDSGTELDTNKTKSPTKSSKDKQAAKKKKKKTYFAQQATVISSGNESSKTENQFLSFTFFGHCNTTANPMKLHDIILLDNQSTVDLFCNRKFVSHVWKTKHSMTVHGNGGTLTTNMKAHVDNYGDVWYDPSAITNILSLKNVCNKYRVTYNSNAEGAFIVHKPDNTDVHFVMHANGLHYHNTDNRQLSFVMTVEEQSVGYSKKQLQQAKRARNFQAYVGYPSTHDLKNIITNNLITDCPVTIQDVDQAKKIYGPSVAILKGKTTRHTPLVVTSDYVAIPPHILSANKHVTLSGNLFFVNKIPFFATISDHIKFTTAEHINNQKLQQLIQASKHVQAIYDARGFEINSMLMDGKFVPLKHELASLGIVLNTTAANQHVPKIEQQIRVIKERVRATRHTLPFRVIPLTMLISMINTSVLWINAFPPSGGVSSHLSPRNIMTGIQFNYKKHCQLQFGSYVQAHQEPSPTNTQAACTVGAICLGPTGNIQASYYFLNLHTGERITQRRWTLLPMPQEVIEHVNQLGSAESQPQLLTFYDRRGQLIGDSVTPGVQDIPDLLHPEPDGLEDLNTPAVNYEFGKDEETDINQPLIDTPQQTPDLAVETENPTLIQDDPHLPHEPAPEQVLIEDPEPTPLRRSACSRPKP